MLDNALVKYHANLEVQCMTYIHMNNDKKSSNFAECHVVRAQIKVPKL